MSSFSSGSCADVVANNSPNEEAESSGFKLFVTNVHSAYRGTGERGLSTSFPLSLVLFQRRQREDAASGRQGAGGGRVQRQPSLQVERPAHPDLTSAHEPVGESIHSLYAQDACQTCLKTPSFQRNDFLPRLDVSPPSPDPVAD